MKYRPGLESVSRYLKVGAYGATGVGLAVVFGQQIASDSGSGYSVGKMLTRATVKTAFVAVGTFGGEQLGVAVGAAGGAGATAEVGGVGAVPGAALGGIAGGVVGGALGGYAGDAVIERYLG